MHTPNFYQLERLVQLTCTFTFSPSTSPKGQGEAKYSGDMQTLSVLGKQKLHKLEFMSIYQYQRQSSILQRSEWKRNFAAIFFHLVRGHLGVC